MICSWSNRGLRGTCTNLRIVKRIPSVSIFQIRGVSLVGVVRCSSLSSVRFGAPFYLLSSMSSLEVCRVCLQVFRLIQLYQPTYCGQPVQQTCFLFVTNNGRATKPGTIISVPRTLFPCDSGHCACHILWRFVGHHTLSLDVSKMCTTIVYLAWRSGAHLDSK